MVEKSVLSELMGRIQIEMDCHINDASNGKDTFVGPKTERTGSVIARSVAAQDLIMNKNTLGVAERFLAYTVVPSSQYGGRKKKYTLEDIIPTAMKIDSSLFHTGRIHAGASENKFYMVLHAFSANYTVGSVRQENQYSATPLEIAGPLPM